MVFVNFFYRDFITAACAGDLAATMCSQYIEYR